MREPRGIGICFTGEMVRAIMAGRKTQTRRPMSPQLDLYEFKNGILRYGFEGSHRGVMASHAGVFESGHDAMKFFVDRHAPYAPGDVIIVRETWHCNHKKNIISYRSDWPPDNDPFKSETCGEDCSMVGEKWRPSIFMPEWATRIRRRVLRVWPQRIREITLEDVFAEGCILSIDPDEMSDFENLWNSIYLDPRPRTKNGEITHHVCWPWSIEDFRAKYGSITKWKGLPLTVYDNPWTWAAEFEKQEA